MDINDFRGMRRGTSLFALSKKDAALLNAIEQRNGRKERALLLLHGFTSTPAVFRTMLPSLVFYDTVICPILPGHAENLEAFANAKAEHWFNTAKQACEALIAEFKHVDVLGLSLGGLLACHLSNCFNIQHLYLLAPALDLYISPERTLKLAKALKWLGFKEIRGQSGDLFTNEQWEIAYRKLPLNAVIEIAKLIKEFSFISPTCPTDVFLGSHDKVVDSKRVAERFANLSNVAIHWLHHSAHVIPLDGDTEIILNCMKKYRNLPDLTIA
jgi:carboxylesterase